MTIARYKHSSFASSKARACLLLLSVACLCPLSFSSCSDFLEADNKASIEAEAYFSTPEGQDALRVVMYSGLKPIVNNTALTEFGTDLYVASRGTNPGNLHQYIIESDDSDVKSFYQSLYSMINNANCMLKYATENAQYAAEATFIRAYGYYMLVQQFGDVPYVDAYIETATKDYPRTPIATVYQHIIADLEGIANSSALPADDHEGHISQRAVKALLAKVCLAAGWDLGTRLDDAVRGAYTVVSTDYFTKSAQYADQVINGQQLTMSFEEKWSPANEGNAEEIFSVQYDRSGYPGDVITGGHNRQNAYGSTLGNPTENGMKSVGSNLTPSAKAIYLWAKGDERLEGTFMMTTCNYFSAWQNEGYYAYYFKTEAECSAMTLADKYFPWYVSLDEVEQYISDHEAQFVRNGGKLACQVHVMADPATSYSMNANGKIGKKTTNMDYMDYLRGQTVTAVAPTVKKFDDPETPQQNNSTGYRDIVVLHLSDIYLTAAEAYLMAGNQQRALDYINAVRSRAKAATLSSFGSYEPDYERDASFSITPLDVLLDERARELYGETCRWIDLRRTRQLVRYNVAFNPYVSSASEMSNVRGEIKWYRPIPAAEIETNTAISQQDQNAGY